MFSCSYCPAQFTYQDEWVNHLAKHRPDSPNSTDTAPEDFVPITFGCVRPILRKEGSRSSVLKPKAVSIHIEVKEQFIFDESDHRRNPNYREDKRRAKEAYDMFMYRRGFTDSPQTRAAFLEYSAEEGDGKF
nr:hypothetical protein K-LCC10_0040 [Kaumoebavirus]